MRILQNIRSVRHFLPCSPIYNDAPTMYMQHIEAKSSSFTRGSQQCHLFLAGLLCSSAHVEVKTATHVALISVWCQTPMRSGDLSIDLHRPASFVQTSTAGRQALSENHSWCLLFLHGKIIQCSPMEICIKENGVVTANFSLQKCKHSKTDILTTTPQTPQLAFLPLSCLPPPLKTDNEDALESCSPLATANFPALVKTRHALLRSQIKTVELWFS